MDVDARPLAPLREIENTWIDLRDGTRLAARVWMPVDAVASPVPAVLEYLPYRKDDATAAADARRHPYFAAHGYAAVRVDLRGTGDSDGLLRGEYLPQEQDDALEVLEWLERQPWCSGQVGMIGYSWGGFNGLQVAARRPPQLKAVITVASTDDRYLDDCHYMGGCLLASDMLKWSASMLTYALLPPDLRFVGERWLEMWRHRLEHAPELAFDWVSHQWRDDFWKHGSVAEDYGAIECPVMVVGGWADAYTNAVPRLLAHLDVPRLGLIGPWGHMLPHEGVPGPTMDFLREAVRWWDTWLKGIDSGMMQEPFLRAWMQDYVPPDTFHAVRPGRWVRAGSWPPDDVATVSLRLTSEGMLAGPAPLESGGPADVSADDDRPFPHVDIRGRQECGETAGVWCANGYEYEIAGEQSPDDERSLCFTTPPLSGTLEVLGFPVARLRVRADRPQALVGVRVEDVAPDGSSLLVSWGMLNLSHRDSHEAPAPLQPGLWYDVRIESRVCAHRFAVGHRLRLALSPTYWPHAWPSPQVVALSVAVDGPSRLELPVRIPSVVTERSDRAGALSTEVSSSGAGGSERAGEPHGAVGSDAAGDAASDDDGYDRRRREIRVDQETGLHQLIDREVHERSIASTGARYRDTMTDVYSIVEDEPLTARVRCSRETSSTGGAVDWRVMLESEMTCDAQDFYLHEEYWAYTGEAEVFHTKRSYTVPRREV